MHQRVDVFRALFLCEVIGTVSGIQLAAQYVEQYTGLA